LNWKAHVAGALQGFQAAVDADPDNPTALNNLGQVLVRSGRAREAIPHLDRAVDLSPTTWAFQFNRARAYAQIEAWPRAVAGYRSAAAIFPGDYVTQFNLARALEANGDLDDAITAYRKAIALAPAEPEFPLSLAHALEQAQQPREAAAAYQQFLELQPSSPQAEKIKARITQLLALSGVEGALSPQATP
jgi:protein O-mannosyl-transferase